MILSLRPAQARVLEYVSGPLAITAVPGAGKTFILTQLARRLVQELGVAPRQILILTYMRSAAATFRARIAAALSEAGLTAYGLQAMTIHAFSLQVLRRHHQTTGDAHEGERPLEVLSEHEVQRILHEGMRLYLSDPARAATWTPPPTSDDKDPVAEAGRAARRLISAAKHHRLGSDRLDELLGVLAPEVPFLFRHYRATQEQQGLVDFDDQIQQAIRLLRTEPELLEFFHQRHAYVLEDEAQDSTPAQHELIGLLTDRAWGGSGNLVRVGDPNQAITTTFTFNDPRYFRDFCELLEPAGRLVRMDESSRSAPEVLELANALVSFSATHPEPTVSGAFLPQIIRPAMEGKTNPAALAPPGFRIYPSDREERDQVLLQVRAFLAAHPEATAAVLLYAHKQVDEYAETARALGIALFEGGLKQLPTARVLAVLGLVLETLALAPQPERRFVELANQWLAHHGGGWESLPAVRSFLKTRGLAALVYPEFELPPMRPPELPEGDYGVLLALAAVWRHMLDLRHLPAEELLPLVVEDFFQAPEAPLIASKALRVARRQLSLMGTLPDNPWLALREEFGRLATASRGELLSQDPSLAKPSPGQLQLMTTHASKGAEFDAVWLPALGFNHFGGTSFPWIGTHAYLPDVGRLVAEAVLRRNSAQDLPSRAELETQARAELVAERLRLLYVAITRAERQLQLSVSAKRDARAVAPDHVLHLGRRCVPLEGP